MKNPTRSITLSGEGVPAPPFSFSDLHKLLPEPILCHSPHPYYHQPRDDKDAAPWTWPQELANKTRIPASVKKARVRTKASKKIKAPSPISFGKSSKARLSKSLPIQIRLSKPSPSQPISRLRIQCRKFAGLVLNCSAITFFFTPIPSSSSIFFLCGSSFDFAGPLGLPRP